MAGFSRAGSGRVGSGRADSIDGRPSPSTRSAWPATAPTTWRSSMPQQHVAQPPQQPPAAVPSPLTGKQHPAQRAASTAPRRRPFETSQSPPRRPLPAKPSLLQPSARPATGRTAVRIAQPPSRPGGQLSGHQVSRSPVTQSPSHPAAQPSEPPASPAAARRRSPNRPLGAGSFCSPQAICSSTLDPVRDLRTRSRVGMRWRSSSTCDTNPTTRPPARSSSRMFITTSSVSASRVPKPSSTKRVSSSAPPVSPATTSARPNASDSDARNDSPPESVFAGRTAPE